MTNKNLNLGTYKFDTSQLDWYKPDYSKLDKAQQGILDSYGETKNAYNQGYQTDIQALDNSWKNFLERDKQSRLENKQAFSAGQQTIAEDSFDRLRGTQNDLSARGLGASGLAQAGVVQDRIEKGRSINSLANQFVNQGTQLNLQAQEAQDNYGTTRQKYADTLRLALSDLLTKENTTKMDYTKMITDLEKSVADSRNDVLNSRGEWERLFQTDTNNNTVTQANWNQTQDEWTNTLSQQALQEQIRKEEWANTLAQQEYDKTMTQKQFDESVRQFNENMALSKSKVYSSGGGGGGSTAKSTTAKASITPAQLQTTIEQLKRNGASFDQIDNYIKQSFNVPANFSSWTNNDQYGKKSTGGTAGNQHKISVY